MKFIHLTDPHLVDPARLLYGVDPTARLNAAIAEINADHGDAAFLLVTGDLTHWGEAVGYEALVTALSRLCIPHHLALGNHDDRGRFLEAVPDSPRDADGFVQYAFPSAVGTFVILDTLEAGTSKGAFCEARAAWLRDTLATTAGPVFIAMHHPPFDTGIPAMDRIGLRDRAAFIETIEPHLHRVRHLFFGHLHRPMGGSWRGVPFSTVRSTCHQVALELSGVGGLMGNLEIPQFAVVLADDAQIVVHLHDYAADAPAYRFADLAFRDRTDSVDPFLERE
mgnify:CR=1 FL=1